MIIFSGNQSQSYLAIHCLFAMCQQSPQHALRLSQTNKRRRKKKKRKEKLFQDFRDSLFLALLKLLRLARKKRQKQSSFPFPKQNAKETISFAF
jgi:hypothetical protein